MSCTLRRFNEAIKELYKNGLSARKIAEELEISKTSVAKIIKSLGISRGNLDWQNDTILKDIACKKTSIKRKYIPQPLARKYNVNIDLFKNTDDAFESYLFGIITTDGYVNDRTIGLMVSSIDTPWMQLISDRLNVPLKIDNRGYPYFNINSVEIVNTLRCLGLNKYKTSNPQPITIPSLERDFLRGLIDGDGSVGISKSGVPYVYFGNTNKQLVEWVHLKMTEKGARCKVHLVNNRPSQKTTERPHILPFYDVRCSSQPAKLLLNDIYYDDCFAIPRKFNKAREGIKWQRLRF